MSNSTHREQKKQVNKTKAGINTPHDTLFKEHYKDPKNVQPIIELTVPDLCNILKLDTLRANNEQLASKSLLKSIPDLLFTCELQDNTHTCVFILIEHKSKPDKFVAVQVLTYMSLIWDFHRKKGTLPFIIPLIFYHGKENWKPLSMRDLLPNNPELLKYVPDFTLPFFSLKEIPSEKLFNDLKDKAMLILLKSLLQKDDEETNRYIAEFILQKNNQIKDNEDFDMIHTLEIFFNYLAEVNPEITIDTIGEQLAQLDTGGNNMRGLTLKEQVGEHFYNDGLERGKLEGEQLGLQKGRLEGLLQAAKKLLNMCDDDEIAGITGLPLQQIQQLRSCN